MEIFSDSNGILGSVESLIGGRRENQDSYAMTSTRLGTLIVVCDGMGGGPGGKTASSIATQAILRYISELASDANPYSAMQGASEFANESVIAEVQANPSLRGMGTTCVCLLLTGEEAYIMHVGDSRCYQLRDGKCVFRTSDHSYVGELVRSGSLSEEEARMSGNSNIITRAIGIKPEIEADVDVVKYKPGDRFALMTDGVWGAIPEPQLIGLLAYDKQPAELVPLLTARIDSLGISSGGGHDNLTLSLIEIPGIDEILSPEIDTNIYDDPFSSDPDADDTPVKIKRRSHLLEFILGGALVVALGVIAWLLYIGYADFGNSNEKDDGTLEALEYSYPRMVRIKDVKSGKGMQNGVAKEKEGTNSSHGNSVRRIEVSFDTIISTLNNVKNYKPVIEGIKLKGSKKKESKKKVERHREKMIEDALSKLEKIASSLESRDSAKSNKIRNIASRIRKDKQTMVKVDGKWLHSRADANQAIDRSIAEILALGIK